MRKLLTILPLLAIGACQPAYTHDAIPTAAQPNGWRYPLSCCSGYDCREVDESAIDESGPGYTIVATGEFIPMTDAKIKPSPDGMFHLCQRGGKPDGAAICLFVPPRGF